LLAFSRSWEKYGLLLIGVAAGVIGMLGGYVSYVHIPLLVFGLFALFFSIYQRVPKVSQADDELGSREFWMFIGALVFVISCFQVIISTSMPVWNKLFGLDKAPPADVIGYYNKWQMPIAILIGLLIGFGQLLKYKKTDLKVFRIRLLSVVLSSAGITLLL